MYLPLDLRKPGEFCIDPKNVIDLIAKSNKSFGSREEQDAEELFQALIALVSEESHLCRQTKRTSRISLSSLCKAPLDVHSRFSSRSLSGSFDPVITSPSLPTPFYGLIGRSVDFHFINDIKQVLIS